LVLGFDGKRKENYIRAYLQRRAKNTLGAIRKDSL
jgi:hypothetical protein